MFYKHSDSRPDWTNAKRYPKMLRFLYYVHVFQVFLCSVAEFPHILIELFVANGRLQCSTRYEILVQEVFS